MMAHYSTITSSLRIKIVKNDKIPDHEQSS